jgi:predicted XRE-type DNA-binding protein
MNYEGIKAKLDERTEFEGECWVWKGAMRTNGYGSVRWVLEDGTVFQLPHRASYTVFNGEIPKGMFVCHSCDNRACVNPDHLWVGTNADNMDDMWKKGRNKKMLVTEELCRDVQEHYKQGMRQVDLAKKFGVSQQTISLIVRRETRFA